MKRHILLLCLSLGALAGPVAQAQVHRCSTASGATVYSDAPCSEGQTGRLIERHKSPEELQQESAQAAAANDRQARERTAERLRQDVLSTVPERSAAAAPLPSDSPACKNVLTISQGSRWSAIGMSGCSGCAAWARAHASSRGVQSPDFAPTRRAAV